jgi:RNA polymerase sigma-70 factor, ECF subfamily
MGDNGGHDFPPAASRPEGKTPRTEALAPPALSIEEIASAIRRGDDQGAESVFQRYAADLVRLADEQIASRHRPKFDGEDVVQSALRSFFVQGVQGQFELTSWDGLWGLLVRITLRKCGRTATFWDAQLRDTRREVSLESAAGASSGQSWQAYEPDPHQAVLLRETVDRICRELTGTQQQIFLMDLEGYTAAEIGERIGRSVRTVRRTLAEVRVGLKKFAEAESRNASGEISYDGDI